MIIIPDEKCTPLFEKIIAFWLPRDFFCGGYGKNKMKVGVNQLLVFYAGRAGTAGIGMIPGTTVPAINELCVSNRKRQLFIAFWSEEHLGMAHPGIQNGLDQFLLDHFLPDDFTEPHVLQPISGSKFMGFPDGKNFFPDKFPPGVIA